MSKQTTNMARVIGQIQTMARKINTRWFNDELPIDECVWTVSSQPRSYGFFTPYNSYKIYDKVQGERDAVQISLGSETLTRPIENICATLIHEMVHWYNFINDIKDVSRGNTYHNKNFKNEAERRGISISYDSRIGWSVTEPTEELISWILEESFEELRMKENSLNSLLIGGLGTSGTITTVTPKKSHNIKLICPCCGQIVRTTNPNHKIGCWDCMVQMIEA